MKHIIRSQDFSREYIEDLFRTTQLLQPFCETYEGRERLSGLLKHRIFYLAFYQPSTRTRFSFESAGKLTGAYTMSSENAAEYSSEVKGEITEDTIHTFCRLRADCIIIRHKDNDAAEISAKAMDKYRPQTKLINAGNGKGQHPTQSLIDLFAIKRNLGRMDDFTALIAGDLDSRTPRSLAYLLSKFNNIKIIFASPPNMRMGQDLLDHLEEHRVPFDQTDFLDDAMKQADMVYMTRAQKEYHPGEKDIKFDDNFRITLSRMEFLKDGAFLTHPLPIAGEVDREAVAHPKVKCFEAVEDGQVLRMALLCKMFNADLSWLN